MVMKHNRRKKSCPRSSTRRDQEQTHRQDPRAAGAPRILAVSAGGRGRKARPGSGGVCLGGYHEMRHFAGHRPAEKERHQEPQGSEKDAVHPRGQMGVRDGSSSRTRTTRSISISTTARWSRPGRRPAAATRRSPDCATSPCAATTASAAALTHASSCPRPLRRAMTSAR